MNLLVGSLRGSPGVTSLLAMLGHAWQRDCMLIEADLSGGVLAARYNLLQGNPGLLNLVTKYRRSSDIKSIKESFQYLPGGVPVVVATGRSSTIEGLIKEIPLLDMREALPKTDIFLDMGRMDISICPENLLKAADILILVVHPYFEQLDTLLLQIAEFGMHKIKVGIVIAGTPENSKIEYSKSEIDTTLNSVSNGQAFVLGELVYDRKAAFTCFAKGPAARTLTKSLLYKGVKGIAQNISQFLAEPQSYLSKGVEEELVKVKLREEEPLEVVSEKEEVTDMGLEVISEEEALGIELEAELDKKAFEEKLGKKLKAKPKAELRTNLVEAIKGEINGN